MSASRVHAVGTASLTDGDLTAPPRAGSPRGWWRAAVDRLAGSDPGLSQLRTALQAVLGMALALLATWGLVHATGAMQVDPAGLPPAVVAAQHHGALVVALIVSGLVAMLASFNVRDATVRGQLVSGALLPLPMLASVAVGIALSRWHPLALAWMVVALAGGVYLRRFGPRGFSAGMVLFQGAFFGYFLAAEIALRDLGWLAAFMAVGVVASLVVSLGLLRTDARRTLLRMWQSWRARAGRLLLIASEIADTGCSARRRTALHEQLARQLTRLNEATLMIDGQLADPDSSRAALLLHQRLFDMELALTNVCRFAVGLTDRCPDPDVRAALREALAALLASDHPRAAAAVDTLRATRPADHTTAVLVDRFSQSVLALSAARREWLAVARAEAATAPRPADHSGTDTRPAGDDDARDGSGDEAFVPAVELAGGWLPGSVSVSEEAGRRRGPNRWLDGATVPPYLRTAIQAGVAGTIAVLAGGALSQQRLYWAMLSAFLAFLATSNTGEQVRKAFFRMGGTAVGIVLGYVVVHLIGGNLPASFAIIGVSLFLGIYLIRVNYTFMAAGVSISMSLLYEQLGEFSWSLLVLRLEETALGVGAVIVTVLLVLPLRPQRVLTAGVLLWFRALEDVVDKALATVEGADPVTRLDVRRLDAAQHDLVTTARPLQHATFGRHGSQLREILAVTAAARYYTRNLATGVRRWDDLADLPGWPTAAGQLRGSLAVIGERLEQRVTAPYVRSAALFDVVDRELPADRGRDHLVLRDLMLLDGAMARLAVALRLPVHDHDTAGDSPGPGALSPRTGRDDHDLVGHMARRSAGA